MRSCEVRLTAGPVAAEHKVRCNDHLVTTQTDLATSQTDLVTTQTDLVTTQPDRSFSLRGICSKQEDLS